MIEELDHPDNFKHDVCKAETRLKRPWEAKQKYEYVKVAVDMRHLDRDGSLEVATHMDKDSCKRIPIVKVVDGFLIVALRREL